MAFTSNSQNIFKPIIIEGDSGFFINSGTARKVLKDYTLLDNTLKRNTTLDSLVVVLSAQVGVATQQSQAHKTNADQWEQVANKYKAQSLGFQQMYVDEQKLRRKQRIKAICLYVILPAGAGAIGYVAGRYIPH